MPRKAVVHGLEGNTEKELERRHVRMCVHECGSKKSTAKAREQCEVWKEDKRRGPSLLQRGGCSKDTNNKHSVCHLSPQLPHEKPRCNHEY